ncbi:MAG: MCE family protein [Myxococcales bacterium]|nr:MCE family protein [Myxococcales bacterium]
MSLGPPFDDAESSERLRLGLGFGMTAVLLFFAGFAILTAERSLGDSLTLHVDVTRVGTLHAGAPLRLAGEQIGEVVAIRGRREETDRSTGSTPRIDIEVRLLRQFRERVRRNSTVVTVNPTLLTEAQLEVGPPWNGEAPGEAVKEGDHLRGVDPVEMSLLLVRVYRSLEAALAEAKDLSPDWHEFGGALSSLASHVRETMPTAELLRLALHIERARRGIVGLRDTLQAAQAETAPERLRGLYERGKPLVAELSRLAGQLEALQSRVQDLQAAVLARKADLQRIESLVRATAQLGERVRSDSQALLWLYENGRGTLGGFSHDIQIFDELKEMHRILKRESWRVLIKRKPR